MRYIIILILLAVFFSCNNKMDNDSIKKLESFSNDFNTEDFDNILVIPIEMGCEYCVLKLVEFLRVFNVSDNSLVILTASSKASLRVFLDDHVLNEVKNIHLDDDNYFFNNGLSFLSPVLYVKEKINWDRIELYPVNIEDELFNIFVQNSNEKVVRDYYDLLIEGQISNYSKIGSKNSLEVNSIDSFGFDSLYYLDFSLEKILLKGDLKGMIIQKEEKSFYFYTYDIMDSTSAIYKRNIPKFME